MTVTSLDVGCGSSPKGTVNIDFFRKGFNPQTGDQKIGDYINRKNIKNFVIGDVTHLPFKEAAFDIVFSIHVIEHVADPLGMLREMNRVCKRKIIVKCPHRKGSNAVKPFHINYLDEYWFQRAASLIGLNMQYSIVYEFPIIMTLSRIVPRKLKLRLKRLVK